MVQDAVVVQASETSVIYSCLIGHRFPDGYVNKSISCVAGTWQPDNLPRCLSTTVPFIAIFYRRL